MNHREKSRLDRFAFALGSFGIAGSYAVIPVVANDRIAAAWDKRLGAASDEAGHDPAPSRFGWAT